MVPCPWLTEVAAYAKAHPDADLGLHLTLTSEWKTYRWGPVASKDTVPSLLDPSGYLWPDTDPAKQHIKAEEAEREIRAQIEKALSLGNPSHSPRQPHGSAFLAPRSVRRLRQSRPRIQATFSRLPRSRYPKGAFRAPLSQRCPHQWHRDGRSPGSARMAGRISISTPSRI